MQDNLICNSIIFDYWIFWFFMIIVIICVIIGFQDIVTWFLPIYNAKVLPNKINLKPKKHHSKHKKPKKHHSKHKKPKKHKKHK
jgi:hypothetical protein